MSRFRSMIMNDIRFQVRHGIYSAYALITTMYVLLLFFLPERVQAMAITLIVFSDPSVLGFFFVGGIILLERGQNVMDNLFVSPLRLKEYLLAKAGSLAVLSVTTSVVIHGLTLGFSSVRLPFVLGVLMTSVFFTLLGIGLAVRCRSTNGFFLKAPMYTLVFILPLLPFLNLFESSLFFILPTHSTLQLLGASHQGVTILGTVWHFLWLSCWILLVYRWAYFSFDRFVLQKIGG